MYYWQVILTPGLEMGILMKTLISFIDKKFLWREDTFNQMRHDCGHLAVILKIYQYISVKAL